MLLAMMKNPPPKMTRSAAFLRKLIFAAHRSCGEVISIHTGVAKQGLRWHGYHTGIGMDIKYMSVTTSVTTVTPRMIRDSDAMQAAVDMISQDALEEISLV